MWKITARAVAAVLVAAFVALFAVGCNAGQDGTVLLDEPGVAGDVSQMPTPCVADNDAEISALKNQIEQLQAEIERLRMIEPPALPTVDAPLPPTSAPPQGEGDIAWITAVDAIDVTGMNVIRKDEFSFVENNRFSSNVKAEIILYVDAEKLDDGEFGFDTGHEWLLVIRTPLGYYQLFPRKVVQHGRVDYKAFYEGDDDGYNTLHVVVMVDMSASYKVYDCIFDFETEAFRVMPIYSNMNINPQAASYRR